VSGNLRHVFVIAEAGVNHNGDMAIAKKLIDAASDAGADAVKFQTFKAERVASAAAPKAAYQTRTTDAGETQIDMLRRLEFPYKAHGGLMAHCAARGIEFMSTPFDAESAAMLAELGVARIKIGSGELTNLPFLRAAARHGIPMILSTGMADLDEIGESLDAVREAGCDDVSLLHCVSNYPADPGDANLRAMKTMADAFNLPVGYSDHTPGTAVAIAAAALGATIVEKHFTLDRTMPGPDHEASIEPDVLAELVTAIRTVEVSLGDGIKRPAESEMENRRLVRRSLVAAKDIAEGTALKETMLDALRPGTGLPPSATARLLGRKARRDISAGTVLTDEMFS
jgi:N-acetylneuraminate synthase